MNTSSQLPLSHCIVLFIFMICFLYFCLKKPVAFLRINILLRKIRKRKPKLKIALLFQLEPGQNEDFKNVPYRSQDRPFTRKSNLKNLWHARREIINAFRVLNFNIVLIPQQKIRDAWNKMFANEIQYNPIENMGLATMDVDIIFLIDLAVKPYESKLWGYQSYLHNHVRGIDTKTGSIYFTSEQHPQISLDDFAGDVSPLTIRKTLVYTIGCILDNYVNKKDARINQSEENDKILKNISERLKVINAHYQTTN